jgi:Ca2+-transporting ATPase
MGEAVADRAEADACSAASTLRGLSSEEAARRLLHDGPNRLPQPEKRRWPQLTLSIVREPMLLLLIAAALIYLVLGDARDAAVLAISVLLVVALTLYQEWRSERALRALRELSSPIAHVLRDGLLQRVPAEEVVVDDVIRIGEGDRVPADGYLLASNDLHMDESLLTGESAPVARDAIAMDMEARRIRAGTLAVRGQADAKVTAIGSDTDMGRIGASLGDLQRVPTPLQREIRRLVAWFASIGIASCVLVVALYVTLRGGWLDALLAGITLAMANIPEEFPVVLTVFLALGAWRMARHRVLVRRPPAIEALGAVTVLCTDKTGTLTENRMSLARLVTDDGTSAALDQPLDAARTLLRCAASASDQEGLDPMDRAIHEAIVKRSVQKHAPGLWLRRYPVSPGFPVYANAWRVQDSAGLSIACKGAPETVAELCGMPPELHRRVLAQAASMAADGLRVIAAAETTLPAAPDAPADLRTIAFQWRGLLGLADPLRKEVPGAVAEARSAGVRVIMLTGDHIETARAIAAAAGIGARPEVALGSDLERLDDAGVARLLAHADVFARVRPEHKLRLVEALKAQGEVVAMTGDGVNDAPALAAAHVGVAMGGRGTDVAREAASIVILDDDFVSVVRAIRLGRNIYDNLQRATRYIIAVHVPITGLALLPLLLGTPLILLPLHIVFLEMIIDPASTIALEREPPAPDLMRRPPRRAGAKLIGLRTFAASAANGSVVFGAVAAAYAIGAWAGLAPPQQAALAFATLIAGNLGLLALHCSGSSRKGSNKALLSIAALSLALLALVVLAPGPARWFGFAPLPPLALLGALLLPSTALWVASGLQKAWRERAIKRSPI